MKRVRARGEDVRRFILEHLEKHPSDLARVTAEHFKITRQAVNKHLQRLASERAILNFGKTRNRTYQLAALLEWRELYPITPELAEDRVWREQIRNTIGELPDNALDIWQYGFTEILNNAIDHSAGKAVDVSILRTAITTEILIRDDGVGIFKKIQTAFGLLDERHAVLELAKGKLTTDPTRHSGEGIFFSSRMFDEFDILSGGLFFSHRLSSTHDWLLERDRFQSGTAVWMKLNNHTSRTTTKVFKRYTSGDEFCFTKTVVPVNLARYGNENLISRSQAKRLLARIESFKMVVFDFENVPTIGQAFADEIFRVFAQSHPDIDLFETHANSEVKRMIARAKSAGATG